MKSILQRWFSGENSLKGATKLLVVTLFLSNILGVIRDRYLAQKIPTNLLDTYYAAFRIPDLIFNILILGAIASAFIPVFSGLISRKKQAEAWLMANEVISVVMAAMLVVLTILYFIMPFVVPLLAPYFSPDKQQTTAGLARLFLISPFLFGLSYFLSGVLNSYKRFFVYSLAPLVYNLAIIIATVFFGDRYGVYAATIGVVAGALLHVGVQLPTALKIGFKFTPRLSLANKNSRAVLRLMGPRVVGVVGQQLVWLGFTGIGSGLGAGAVAIYNLADNIQTMPTAVFGSSVSSAVFPHLSEYASLNRRQDFARSFEKSAVSILFFLVPATFGIVMLRAQIVRLLLGSGYFGWEQTIQTANALGFFGLTLIFSGLVPLLAKSFYAFKDTKTPSVVAVASAAFSLGSGYVLARQLGVAGLALAFSFGSVVNAGVLYWLLKARLPEINEANILAPFIKMFTAALIMAGGLQIAKQVVGTIFDLDRYWEILLQTGLAVAVSLGIYFGLMKLFGLPSLSKMFSINGSTYKNKL